MRLHRSSEGLVALWSPEEAESKWRLKEGCSFSPSPQQLEKDVQGNPTLGFTGDLRLFLWFQCSDLARGFYTHIFPPPNWQALTLSILFFLIQKDKEKVLPWHCHFCCPRTKELTAVLYGFPTLPSTLGCLFFFKHSCLQHANKNWSSFNTAICLLKHQSLFSHEPALSQHNLQTAVQHRGVFCPPK